MVYEYLKYKFDRDGYVVINNFLTKKEVEDLRTAGEKLTVNPPVDSKTVFTTNQTKREANSYFMDSADTIGFFYEKNALDENKRLLVDPTVALNKVGHALHRLHPVFEAFDEHQDSTFLFTEPDSLVGFWIALDDAKIENGCLWIIPGSHKTVDLQKRFIRNPNICAVDEPMVFQGTNSEYDQSLYVPVAVDKFLYCYTEEWCIKVKKINLSFRDMLIHFMCLMKELVSILNRIGCRLKLDSNNSMGRKVKIIKSTLYSRIV
ncbi:phytanoyl-CoA dioxygenase domain-containing protein 1 homolog isoform X3 [Sipha flava]|uniref:Phytanoyl-CoA dioxygenase domain-containing protein 1 homolog isoform X3 n=1 Tax=Sipha flava TaxID=143950 RepID=A0A8B8GB97_9HEMI|nr:phytanoyl-CoA dioxygenase domain-containing protein 1 homolog isoform X3 [Sipha flava]